MELYILVSEPVHYNDVAEIVTVSTDYSIVVDHLILHSLQIENEDEIIPTLKELWTFKAPKKEIKTSLEQYHHKMCRKMITSGYSRGQFCKRFYSIHKRQLFSSNDTYEYPYRLRHYRCDNCFSMTYDEKSNKFKVESTEDCGCGYVYLHSPLLKKVNELWRIYYPETLKDIPSNDLVCEVSDMSNN